MKCVYVTIARGGVQFFTNFKTLYWSHILNVVHEIVSVTYIFQTVFFLLYWWLFLQPNH